jgi:hypothetical protein
MIYFGDYLKEDKAWRGNLNLVWGDIILERDPENGLEYLTLPTSVKRQQVNASTPKANGQSVETHANTQRRTGCQTGKLRAATGAELTSPRVYARQPPSICPVEAFKIFKARRPNNCLDAESPFYLAPNQKSKPTSKTWYQALAMSCQRLDPLFYCLFKRSCVDLNSLATMTNEQQEEIVAAATATSIEQNDYVVWKAREIPPPPVQLPVASEMPHHNAKSIKNNHSNNVIAQSVANVAQQHQQQLLLQQQQQQLMLQNPTQVSSIIINGQTYTVQQPQPEKQRVPVQVQVQVQVQVLSPLQRQQLQMQQQQQQQHQQMDIGMHHQQMQVNNDVNGATITLL